MWGPWSELNAQHKTRFIIHLAGFLTSHTQNVSVPYRTRLLLMPEAYSINVGIGSRETQFSKAYLLMPLFSRLIDLQFTSADEFALRVGSEQRTGSLYYLGIDPRAPDHNCMPTTGLARLFSSWIERLLQPHVSSPVFLPFDFADETTQWIACETSDNTVHMVFGWAHVEGWAISPSDFGKHATSLPDFTPDEPTFIQSFYLPRLLNELRHQIACLNANPDETINT